jgi:D-psicose/D-tagatose/L-ribulose 3-epimerase
MKFGVNAWVWAAPVTTKVLEELVPHVSEMGYDLVEVPVEAPGNIDYDVIGGIIEDHGLDVSVCAAMGPDRDLIHPDEAIRDSGIAYIKHCIDATQALGGTNLAGPLYSAVGRVWQATPEQREQETNLLVEQLTGLANYAADRGVMLCVEPLNRFETSFINLASQLVEVLDRVDHPNCQAHLDTFPSGPRLHHFHACENDRGAPGSGHVPWQEVAEALGDVDYDGPVVIESFTAEVKSIARAAAIWRPLASSQDVLAEDGLAFLQRTFG